MRNNQRVKGFVIDTVFGDNIIIPFRSLAIFIGITLLFGAGFFYYFAMPVLSLDFFSTVLFVTGGLIIALWVVALLKANEKIIKFGIPIVIFAFIVSWLFSTSGIFHADEYRTLIGEVKTKDFSTDIAPIDINQAPFARPEVAIKMAEKKLGEMGAIGSKAKLGEPVMQNVKGKLVYAIPLLNAGFFNEWSSNGTPGYFIASATNQDDVQFVKELNSKPINLRYQPNAMWSNNLKRHLYMNGFSTTGLTDYSFEIDDNNNPWWAVTTYENTIGFRGAKVTGIALVNPETGEIERYTKDNVPEWVDRILPMDIVEQQINDWGDLVHGWLNPTATDRIKTTNYANVVYDKGICYYYYGITSTKSDQALIGFMLVNSRTYEITEYKIAGSTEQAAMDSAEGKVQQYEYEASHPIPANIEGVATDLMALKDTRSGLIKMYAMVSIQDYSVVGVGDSPKEAMENYVRALAGKGNVVALDSSGKSITLEGTVLRINPVVNDKSTLFYMLLNEQSENIFVIPLSVSNELPLTQVGDKVSVHYNESASYTINALGFDNLQFAQSKTETQAKVEAETK